MGALVYIYIIRVDISFLFFKKERNFFKQIPTLWNERLFKGMEKILRHGGAWLERWNSFRRVQRKRVRRRRWRMGGGHVRLQGKTDDQSLSNNNNNRNRVETTSLKLFRLDIFECFEWEEKWEKNRTANKKEKNNWDKKMAIFLFIKKR